MIKNSVVALVTAAALAGIAMPAMAAAAPATSIESDSDTSSFDADYVLHQLQAQGVNATSVETWGTHVRAFVIGEDGRQTMRLFNADTLQPANI
ncbi:hypothetical protein [Devosia elaeis]|jgi:hypothetical protein|uniref:PepSY domain-containing protein n=1 Tax=Devosia elaeis TaxID=1770058 RepID=A0A178I6M1_9HYPH|nr:hypothetical protein [Devosia elaeis]OAM82302.1 hypothetical protein A3840_01235 [Devosia elaeis]